MIYLDYTVDDGKSTGFEIYFTKVEFEIIYRF